MAVSTVTRMKRRLHRGMVLLDHLESHLETVALEYSITHSDFAERVERLAHRASKLNLAVEKTLRSMENLKRTPIEAE